VAPQYNDGVALAADWKTGYESVPEARTSLQMALIALCLAALGCEAVEVAIVRVDDDGGLHWDRHVMDTLDLEDAHARVAAVLAAVQAARAARRRGEAPKVAEGGHCKWCPAKGSCPVYAREANALGMAGESWVQAARAQLEANDDAAHWLLKVQRAGEVLEVMQGLVKDRVRKAPVTLPDGRVAQIKTQQRKRIDGKLALALLDDLYGPEVAKAAAAVTVTQTSLAEAVGADLAPRVLQDLDARGAVLRYEVEMMKVGKAPAPKKARKRKAVAV
jgi:hypothetical protein